MQPAGDEITLAMTMLGEARGEGKQGMQAVGNTVQNRVAAKTWFGDTIENVCLKHSNGGIYQYSCWNANDPNAEYFADLTTDDLTYQMAYGIAKGLIAGMFTDITNGATHYYRKGTPVPYWAKNVTPVAEIGNHIFFKLD